MEKMFSRTEMLIKKDGLDKLRQAKIAIFGIGGVGSYVLEALVRAGVGNFVLIDGDTVAESNINRQLIATTKTIGRNKVDVAKERVLEINPNANVEIYNEFFLPNSSSNIIDKELTYVIDCVDTVTAKLEIISQCKAKDIPVISSMGTGNKLDPTKFQIADIRKTSVCPLAKVMRKELKNRNITHVKVLFSKEEPIKTVSIINESNKKAIPGSISFVPSVAGLIIAGEVIRDIIGSNQPY